MLRATDKLNPSGMMNGYYARRMLSDLSVESLDKVHKALMRHLFGVRILFVKLRLPRWALVRTLKSCAISDKNAEFIVSEMCHNPLDFAMYLVRRESHLMKGVTHEGLDKRT